jgi:SAM-dependent methyltransferase
MEINNYDPIADLYDIYVPVTFDIDFFVKETKKSPGEVLELMSGTGRVSIPLIEAGVKLTCVDLSAESNAILEDKLRQMGLKADVYQMDVCELALPKKFAMIIIPFHSFAHITSPDDQRKALACIQQHLLPGGTFICTLGNPNIRQKAVDGQLRLLRKYPLPDTQGALLLWVVENHNSDDHQIVEALQFYEEYDGKGVLRSKRLLELHFRLTSRAEFEELAKEAGFTLKALYGDYAYAEFSEESSPFMIWLLENAG